MQIKHADEDSELQTDNSDDVPSWESEEEAKKSSQTIQNLFQKTHSYENRKMFKLSAE